MAREHWRDQPRWPKKAPRSQGGQWRETPGSGGGVGSWIDRLLSRIRPGRRGPDVPDDDDRIPMGDLPDRVRSGEQLEIEYGGIWRPVKSSRHSIPDMGFDLGPQIITETTPGGGDEGITLRHNPGDMLRVRATQRSDLPWDQQIAEHLSRPTQQMRVGTQVTDPHGGEGHIVRRYRMNGLEMAEVEYDGAPGEPQDWAIEDLKRRNS